jgi:hypothetical protein
MRSPSTTAVYRRKLNLKAEVQSGISHFSFKCLVLGAFDVSLIGSTGTALPRCGDCAVPAVHRQRAAPPSAP